jgi:hypothetical protein
MQLTDFLSPPRSDTIGETATPFIGEVPDRAIAIPTPWPETAPAAARIAMVAGFLALACWTVAKGMTFFLHTDELYFWLATYQNGFVRRGLVGTLLLPWLHDVDIGRVHMVAAGCSLLALCATLGLATALFWRVLKSPNCVGACAVADLLATSPFLGLVAHHVGYPDGLIATLLLGTASLLPVAPAPTIAVMLMVCCALHELAFLLLVPVVAFYTVVTSRRRRDFAVLAAGTVAGLCLILLAGSDDTPLVSRVVSAGVAVGEARQQVAVSLHQTGVQALTNMARLWRGYAVNGLFGALYGALPGLCIMALGAPSARVFIMTRTAVRRYQVALMLVYGLSCVGGVALLALAWDLARIASFTTLTSFLTVTLVMRHVRVRPRQGILLLSAIVALMFAVLPVLNLYFEYGRAVNLNLVSRVCPPCAAGGQMVIDAFNRGSSPAARQHLDTDALYGDGGAGY